MKKLYQSVIILLVLIVSVTIAFIQPIEQEPYQQLPHYQILKNKFDSLAINFPKLNVSEQFSVGINKTSITPEYNMPLAGYSKRTPKEMVGILDSSFVTAIVYHNGIDSIVFLSADLLIIHPLLAQAFFLKAKSLGWDHHRIHLSATHTHSGLGGWAPGIIGESFGGSYNPAIVDWIAEKMILSLKTATNNRYRSAKTFFEIDASEYVSNRLVDSLGIVDPWLKVIQLTVEKGIIYHTIFSSHATCFSHKNYLLTSDYPAFLVKQLEKEEGILGAVYSAGAVGSMRPNSKLPSGIEMAVDLGAGLSEQINTISMLAFAQQDYLAMRSFRIEIPLNRPQFRIGKFFCLRPWLFHWLIGKQKVEISYVQLNDLLWIGLPADFSGELAVPMYEYARSKGLNLVITSFNGAYIGYIPKDEWYELDKYETKTMSWYGFDNGAYFTEMITRLIDLSVND